MKSEVLGLKSTDITGYLKMTQHILFSGLYPANGTFENEQWEKKLWRQQAGISAGPCMNEHW